MQEAQAQSLVRELDPTYMPQLRLRMPQLRLRVLQLRLRHNQGAHVLQLRSGATQ